MTSDSTMGVNTGGEETCPDSAVSDGFEPTEKASEFEQQPENERQVPEEAVCDTRIHNQKQADGITAGSDMIKQDLPINPIVDLMDEEGYTPLYKAALKGHLEIADHLISQGANPNKPSEGGLTPLHAAAKEGHRDIVDYLILQGADANVECEKGRTPLHTAAEKGHTDIMDSLLGQGTDVSKEDNTGWTPFNAAVQYGQLEALADLLSKGAKQNRYRGYTPLYWAAHYGHLHIVRFFISKGADVNEVDDRGMIALHGAAFTGHVDVMEYLILQGSDLNTGGSNGWTPFNAAVQIGHLEAVRYLIAKGANQNRYAGMTPLYTASRYGHLDLVNFFISEGADVNEENNDGKNPLRGAAARGQQKVMEYLIEAGSDVNKASPNGWTPFNAAVKCGQMEGIRYLITKGSKQNRYAGMTPLYLAAKSGHLDLVKFFISEEADVNEENDNGRIPLHGATIHGSMEVIEYLVQQRSDVNKCDSEGWTPFSAAVRNGNLEAVKLLMENGAQDTRIHGMTALHIATQYNQVDVTKHLVSRGYNVNERSECGESPLHAACCNGNMGVVKYLVGHNANVNEQDKEGWTPLHAAAQEGHRDVVEFLTLNGADVTAKDIDGTTPIHAAAQEGHRDVVEFLANNAADFSSKDSDGTTPIHAAAQEGHRDVVEFLENNAADFSSKDVDGTTPIHAAAQEGHRDVVEFLAMNGADITAKDIDGWTPLHAAAQEGHQDVVEFLALIGADITAKDIDGWTPIHAACNKGNLDIVKCLHHKNANVNEQDRGGWAPLHAATREGHQDVVEFLALNGADIASKDIDGMTPLQAAKKGGHTKVMEYLTQLGDDTLNEDTSDLRYGSYQEYAHRHQTSGKFQALLEDEDRYGIEGKTHINCPAIRFDPEQPSDGATTDSMDGYSLGDADGKDFTAIHNEYLPTMHPLVEKEEEDALNPFVSAKLKYHGKTATDAEQKQVNGSKGSVPVEMESCISRDRLGKSCPAQYDNLTQVFTSNADHNAISLLDGLLTWKHGGFDQSSQPTALTNCHPYEETEPRYHTILENPFSSTNARNDQPPTENEEKFERPILTDPLAEDHHKSNEGNAFSTKSTSSDSEWKTKKKRRSVDSPLSPVLDVVQSLFYIFIALAIILAGCPVLVVGNTTIDRVTLQGGKSAVIPFNLTWTSVGGSNVNLFYTLRFESKLRPFCVDGRFDVSGFKSPSQLPRFSTSVERLATSICLNLLIESVDTLDEDMYELTVIQQHFQEFLHETSRKEVLVHIPRGPAKCFITIRENNNYPNEVHCHATTGSTETTLTCYQYGQRVEVKGDVSDNGQVTRAVFLLPDQSPFSCCSHDVTSEVNLTMCNDFVWPPSNNHISPPTVNDQSLTPSVANTVAPIGNTEQASNTLVESQVDSGTCKPYMASSVSLTMGLMIYLLLC